MFSQAAHEPNLEKQIDTEQENKTKRDRSRSPLRGSVTLITSPCTFDESGQSGASSVSSVSTAKLGSSEDVANFSFSSVSSYNEFDKCQTSTPQSGKKNTDTSSTLKDSGLELAASFEDEVTDGEVLLLIQNSDVAAAHTVTSENVAMQHDVTSKTDLPALLSDVNWFDECAIVTRRIQQGLSVREALAQSGVCATEIIIDTLRAYPGGFNLRKQENWFSKNQLSSSGLRRILPRIGLHDSSSQYYKKVYDSLQRFSGTYIFLKHALDHGDFPEELSELQRKATQLRHTDPNHNPERNRCQNIKGKLALAFAEDGNHFQCEQYDAQENQENQVRENDFMQMNSNALQAFNNPLRDANQNNAVVGSSNSSVTYQTFENQLCDYLTFQRTGENKSPQPLDLTPAEDNIN